MKRSVVFLCLVGFAALLSVSVGLLELPDSFFFSAIANYLYTGIQWPIAPFNLTIPLTLNAPVYGLWTLPLLQMPHPVGTFLIPFIQLLMIAATCMIVYSVATGYLKKPWGIVAAAVFILMPFLFVYAMTLMSEITGMFLVSVYLYFLMVRGKKGAYHPALLVFVSAVLTLTRFVFSFLFYASCIWWGWTEIRSFAAKKQYHAWKFPLSSRIAGVIGVGLIISWMMFNLQHHKLFALYNETGRSLFYGAVMSAHLLPPSSDPSYKRMMKTVPSTDLLFLPDLKAVLYFAPEFRSGALTETQIDEIFLAFSKSAILHNLPAYSAHIAGMFVRVPETPPYHASLVNHVGVSDPDCPACSVNPCRFVWMSQACRPAIESETLQRLFGRFILFERLYYPYVSLVIFAVVCFGAIVSIMAGGLLRTVAIGYLFFHTVQLIGVLDGRYLIPLYPAYAILFAMGLRQLTAIVRR